MKPLTYLLFLIVSVFSLNSYAKNHNQFAYYGLSLQQQKFKSLDFKPSVVDENLGEYKYKSSDSGFGARVLVGFQFNRFVAIEGGVSRFGVADFKVTEQSTDSKGKKTSTTKHKGEFETLAADLRLVGTLPINDKLFLKAQVGVVGWDNKMEQLIYQGSALATQKIDDRGTSLVSGLGIGYGISKSMALTLDYEKTEIAEIKTDTLSVSLLFRF